jgi:hypothetical protein
MTLSKTASLPDGKDDISGKRAHALDLTPALAAVCYPFLLDAFHFVVGPPGTPSSASTSAAAAVILACILAVPALGLVFATRKQAGTSGRRLAYACVVAPTIYVFLGVLQSMVGSILPDELVWSVLWSGAAVWTWSKPRAPAEDHPAPHVASWRVVHGIIGAIVLLYVGFHVINHLFGLIGPQAHAKVMDLGRTVYRARLIEPLLVALMLFQIASGIYLALRWSASALDFQKTFQIASGFYLSVFILGHMNSVFIYARTFLGIPTDWAFATGAPTGLIHDAWNIRLLPHYLLGVFFVLAHLSSGLRVVLIAHGTDRTKADRIWIACASASAAVAIAIIIGMCGGRIAAL